MKQQLTQELRVAMDLESHEKECAVRYKAVGDKLESLDKRLWRLEAMLMTSTLIMVGLAATLITKL
jgi:hypothetical protein|tara:strand:- start:396 stop:593 length:198 start_codon:yes stop_codon:yes gene_type:complete